MNVGTAVIEIMQNTETTRNHDVAELRFVQVREASTYPVFRV